MGRSTQQGFLVTTLKMHRVYWDPDDPDAVSVFDSLVQLLNLNGQGVPGDGLENVFV